MSWRKYFKTAAAGGALSPISGARTSALDKVFPMNKIM
jgi:hypothetical protein